MNKIHLALAVVIVLLILSRVPASLLTKRLGGAFLGGNYPAGGCSICNNKEADCKKYKYCNWSADTNTCKTAVPLRGCPWHNGAKSACQAYAGCKWRSSNSTCNLNDSYK